MPIAMDVAGAILRHPLIYIVLVSVMIGVVVLVLGVVVQSILAATRSAKPKAWRSLPSWYPLRPKLRVDIFFPLYPAPGVTQMKVAEAYSDGNRGRLHVFDARFQDWLEKRFTQPHIVATGARLQDGVAGEAFRTLAPWREETVRALVDYELPSANLRTELVRLR